MMKLKMMFDLNTMFKTEETDVLKLDNKQIHKGSVLPQQNKQSDAKALFQGTVAPYKVAEYKF